MEDLNGHLNLWGSLGINCNGTIICNNIVEDNLVIMNDGTGTRFTRSGVKESVIDVTHITSELALKCKRERYEDLANSDHYPKVCVSGESKD